MQGMRSGELCMSRSTTWLQHRILVAGKVERLPQFQGVALEELSEVAASQQHLPDLCELLCLATFVAASSVQVFLPSHCGT